MNPVFDITIDTEFLPERSDTERSRWAFAYHISITNKGQRSAQLLTRHWIITDGEEKVHEVHGEGVVGLQPHIAPGQTFTYSSGVMLDTLVGSMYGSYQLLTDAGQLIDAAIPAFTLAAPRALH